MFILMGGGGGAVAVTGVCDVHHPEFILSNLIYTRNKGKRVRFCILHFIFAQWFFFVGCAHNIDTFNGTNLSDFIN